MKIEGKNRGEGSTHVTTACPEAGKWKYVGTEKEKEKEVY